MHFKNVEGKSKKKNLKRTISDSGGLRLRRKFSMILIIQILDRKELYIEVLRLKHIFNLCTFASVTCLNLYMLFVMI